MSAFSVYVAALLVAVASPGPAMFTVLSTGLSRGPRAATAVGAGIALGDTILVLLALGGLVALAAFGWLFDAVKYGGAAYLLWIGIRMWRAPTQADQGRAATGGGLMRPLGLGAAVALGNPKAILFHASLMPLLLDLEALTPTIGAVIAATVFAVNAVAMTAFALLSGRAAIWLATPSRQRWVNRIAGSIMAGTGAAIATR